MRFKDASAPPGGIEYFIGIKSKLLAGVVALDPSCTTLEGWCHLQ
jgi:hypothetical protein